MSCEVIDFNARRLEPFVIRAIELFMIDPPDTDFQRGYLSALINLYVEGLGRKDDRIVAAEKLTRARQ